MADTSRTFNRNPSGTPRGAGGHNGRSMDMTGSRQTVPDLLTISSGNDGVLRSSVLTDTSGYTDQFTDITDQSFVHCGKPETPHPHNAPPQGRCCFKTGLVIGLVILCTILILTVTTVIMIQYVIHYGGAAALTVTAQTTTSVQTTSLHDKMWTGNWPHLNTTYTPSASKTSSNTKYESSTTLHDAVSSRPSRTTITTASPTTTTASPISATTVSPTNTTSSTNTTTASPTTTTTASSITTTTSAPTATLTVLPTTSTSSPSTTTASPKITTSSITTTTASTTTTTIASPTTTTTASPTTTTIASPTTTTTASPTSPTSPTTTTTSSPTTTTTASPTTTTSLTNTTTASPTTTTTAAPTTSSSTDTHNKSCTVSRKCHVCTSRNARCPANGNIAGTDPGEVISCPCGTACYSDVRYDDEFEKTTTSPRTIASTTTDRHNASCTVSRKCHVCTSRNARCPANGNIAGTDPGEVISCPCGTACYSDVRYDDENVVHRGCTRDFPQWEETSSKDPTCQEIGRHFLCFCQGDRCNTHDMTTYLSGK